MRSDRHTVNGLTGYKLGTEQSATVVGVFIATTATATCYAGIRVFVRHADGSEIEITEGTPVAQVSRSSSGGGLQSNTWSCPEVSLAESDAIVVRVYLKSGTGAWYERAVFITEQLNASKLNAATWTVYYYVSKYQDPELGWVWEFDFGTSTYNSRIENFTWTPIGGGGQTYEIYVDALCQSIGTPAYETTYNVSKDANISIQSLKALETAFHIFEDATAQAHALAELSVAEIKVTKLFLVIGSLGIDLSAGRIGVVLDQIMFYGGKTRLFLVIGDLAIQLTSN